MVCGELNYKCTGVTMGEKIVHLSTKMSVKTQSNGCKFQPISNLALSAQCMHACWMEMKGLMQFRVYIKINVLTMLYFL